MVLESRFAFVRRCRAIWKVASKYSFLSNNTFNPSLKHHGNGEIYRASTFVHFLLTTMAVLVLKHNQGVSISDIKRGKEM